MSLLVFLLLVCFYQIEILCIYLEMLATIRFVNIYHLTESYSCFFLVMRMFKIYSVSSFQIYSTVS